MQEMEESILYVFGRWQDPAEAAEGLPSKVGQEGVAWGWWVLLLIQLATTGGSLEVINLVALLITWRGWWGWGCYGKKMDFCGEERWGDWEGSPWRDHGQSDKDEMEEDWMAFNPRLEDLRSGWVGFWWVLDVRVDESEEDGLGFGADWEEERKEKKN